MIKQEKTLLTADTPWGEIKPLIGYVLSERVHKISETPNFRWFFALYLYYFSFAYCKDMKNNPKRAIGIPKTLLELLFSYIYKSSEQFHLNGAYFFEVDGQFF